MTIDAFADFIKEQIEHELNSSKTNPANAELNV